MLCSLFLQLLRLASTVAAIAVLCKLAPAQQPLPQSPPNALSIGELLANACRDDADLNDLAIVSPGRLCAVGNCGTILSTNDSGRSWRSVESNTEANLHAVAFWDEDNGVAVGCRIGAFTRTSQGVVLRTRDGGQNWITTRQDLPGLTGLAFRSNRLVCWGDFSPKYATSVFESPDLGGTWRPIPTALGHARAVGVSRSLVLGVDSLGRTSAQGMGQIQPMSFPFGQRASEINALHQGPAGWVACGQNGLLKISLNGTDWQDCPVPLSTQAQELCHWQSITQRGNDLWVSGSPGSLVLHSPDGGQSWEAVATGQSLPLRCVRFLDEARGWAVGPLGRILATRDGGETWYAQRQAGARAGLLSIMPMWQAVPWAPLLAAAWDSRVTTVNLVATEANVADNANFVCAQSNALADIQGKLGIAGGPFPQHASPEHLAVMLMTWKPDVVLASDPSDKRSVMNRTGSQALLAAIIAAESDQSAAIKELQLVPWSVQKLVSDSDKDGAQYSEQSNRVLREIGLTISNVQQLLPEKIATAARASYSKTVWSRTSNQAATSSLLGAIPPSQDTKRDFQIQDLGSYQLVMGRVHRQKSIERLAAMEAEEAEWLRDLEFVIQSLPQHELEASLSDLANQLWEPSKMDRRLLTLRRLVELRPQSDAARWAMVETLRQIGSDEIAAWRATAGLSKPEPLALSETPGNTPELTPWNATPFTSGVDASVGQSQGSQRSAVTLATATVSATEQTGPDPALWFEHLGAYTQLAPDLLFRPDIALQSHRLSQRMAAQGQVASRLTELVAAPQLIGWPQVMQLERRLDSNSLSTESWIAFATQALERPRLDGQLQEAYWKGVPGMRLRTKEADAVSTNPDTATRVHWAYDNDYLYLAIVCQRDLGSEPIPVQRIRSYDSDLAGVDHVELVLDTDRDYCTAIELAIAEDGRTFDRCCGQAGYNPKWHVCVDSRDDGWTAEVAIELKYLQTRPYIVGEAWAVSARRNRPHAETQGWNRLPADADLLEGSGLLLFLPGD